MEKSHLVGARACISNPALKPFEFLIGDWRTTGTHPMVPGKALPGRTSFAWHEGGAFLIMRTQVEELNFPDGVAIIGSDDAGGTFSMVYFDERGISRVMEVAAGEGMVTWRHDNPDFAQRLTITSQSRDRLVSKGRMSEKRGPWKDDLSQNFERVVLG